MQYMHEESRAFTFMRNRVGVLHAQNIRRGRRSRPITPAEPSAGLRPRTYMHVNAPMPEPEAGG
eukprot:350682-Chlamydomonas_euryale.AAC.2